MNYRTIDPNFAVAGQIRPGQLASLAAAGFKTIVCARPDNEEPGQPSKSVHIPISGSISDNAVRTMKKALKDLPTPMYGYCRSGARAGSLYGAALSP